jgi:protein arginine kinase activator
MKCSVCKTGAATIHITESVSGVPDTKYYCTGCAKQMGLFNLSFSTDDVFKSFDNIMKSFDETFKSFDSTMKSFDETLKHLDSQSTDITCPDCGMTLSKFRALGRFGCAKDYELFKVGPFLEKIHGTSVHMGKAPEASSDDKLKRLKKDMEAAVKSENYEKAASIRDEIKKLENLK